MKIYLHKIKCIYTQNIVDVCTELLMKDKDHSDKKYNNCKVSIFMIIFFVHIITILNMVFKYIKNTINQTRNVSVFSQF